MTNSIKDRLTEIVIIQNSLKIKDLNYSSTKNGYSFKYSLPTVFLRDIYERRLSINDADEEQSILYNEIKRVKDDKAPDEKG